MKFPKIRAACLICNDLSLYPLIWLEKTGVPHGETGHNFVYDYKIFSVCNGCHQAQLEVYSHDCFHYYEDEDWDMYWWYVLDPKETKELKH